jgi:hypothetical protein
VVGYGPLCAGSCENRHMCSRGKIQTLWTCPVNPHLMYIWCNIYLFTATCKSTHYSHTH